MLTRIVFEGDTNINIPILGASTKDSFLLRKATGLNPPGANVYIGEYAGDGGLYTGRRIPTRNIVLTIELNPNPALGETVATLRKTLYRTFMDPLLRADYVRVLLYDDLQDWPRYVIAYAEKIETEIFESENLVQISLLCPDPYIRDTVAAEWRPALYSSSLTVGSSDLLVPYEGSAEVGFEIEARVLTPTSKIQFIINVDFYQVFEIVRPFLDFTNTSVVYVNSLVGKREILMAEAAQVKIASDTMLGLGPAEDTPSNRWEYLKTIGAAQNIFSYMTPNSVWPTLHAPATNNVNLWSVGETGSTGSNEVIVRNWALNAAHWGV